MIENSVNNYLEINIDKLFKNRQWRLKQYNMDEIVLLKIQKKKKKKKRRRRERGKLWMNLCWQLLILVFLNSQ